MERITKIERYWTGPDCGCVLFIRKKNLGWAGVAIATPSLKQIHPCI